MTDGYKCGQVARRLAAQAFALHSVEMYAIHEELMARNADKRDFGAGYGSGEAVRWIGDTRRDPWAA